MSQRRITEVQRFQAITPSGEVVVVVEEVLQVLHKPLSGTQRWLDGVRSYRTEHHAPVNWISDDEFELVRSGEHLRRL